LPALDFDPTEVAVSWRLLVSAGHQVQFTTLVVEAFRQELLVAAVCHGVLLAARSNFVEVDRSDPELKRKADSRHRDRPDDERPAHVVEDGT
jgi:predicted ATPase